MQRNKLNIPIFRDDYGYMMDWMLEYNNLIWIINLFKESIYTRRVKNGERTGIEIYVKYLNDNE